MRYLVILGILFCGIAHASEAPRCNPGDYSPTVNWQVGVASDASIVSILWCNDSTGLGMWSAGWNPVQTPVTSCAGNIKSESPALMLSAFWESCLTGTAAITSAQQTEINHLVQLWMPKLETSQEEGVYPYANGQLTGHSVGRIAANVNCRTTVVATHNSVDYYDVSGLLLANGQVIPAGHASACKLVTPPAAGWPQ
jgi:hypothetical protein